MSTGNKRIPYQWHTFHYCTLARRRITISLNYLVPDDATIPIVTQIFCCPLNYFNLKRIHTLLLSLHDITLSRNIIKRHYNTHVPDITVKWLSLSSRIWEVLHSEFEDCLRFFTSFPVIPGKHWYSTGAPLLMNFHGRNILSQRYILRKN
jgi:hypothetical protein